MQTLYVGCLQRVVKRHTTEAIMAITIINPSSRPNITVVSEMYMY